MKQMSEFNINEDAQSGGEYSGSQSSCNEPNSQPIESAFPDEDEETITMLDVIEREDKLEEEASAVLGNSDEKNCTYPKGYIPRQALYSCATCSEGSDDKVAAICLACSLECHDNHEVFELYTKRNYRCDCGNSKFNPEFVCKLMDKDTEKAEINENNKYNHNFSGRYCTCNKRYPPDDADDSAEANDEMWQCIVCEDWYHTKHLGAKELPTKFDELICGNCVGKLEFVQYYKGIDKNLEGINRDSTPSSSTKITKADTEEQVNQNPQTSTSYDVSSPTDSVVKKAEVSQNGNPACESDTNDSQAENKDPVQSSDQVSTDSTEDNCILEKLKRAFDEDSAHSNESKQKEPLFWSDCAWRSKLCQCQNCLAMYKSKECEFLLDDKDTVQYYEAQGRVLAKSNGTPYERGMSALNRMPRGAVIEALHGYDELKADLSTYLRKFADTKKVVREEDIHDFFQQLKSKKRPRLEYE